MEIWNPYNYFEFQSAFMNTQNQHLEALQDIKQMMQRSSRFISLSGLSGIAAGICGLASAFIAHLIIERYYVQYDGRGYWSGKEYVQLELELSILGVCTLGIALILGYFFTWRKANAAKEKIWNTSSKRLLINVCIPLAAGGVFIYGMLSNHEWRFVGPACLVFYGLALINGSKYTLDDIRYLGILEIILGSFNFFYIGYGLYFWAVGFGLLHIVYGIIMWNKYERKETS